MATPGQSITQLLHSAATTPEIVDKVLPVIYNELRNLARHFLKSERSDHTLQTTELVHEAYMRLFGLEEVLFKDHRHFFSTAALSMRRILVDHARRNAAKRRIPAGAKIQLAHAEEIPATEGPDLIALDAALEKLERLNPRQAQIVELRFFAGLTESQVAQVLEISRPTVARDFRVAKIWLRRRMKS